MAQPLIVPIVLPPVDRREVARRLARGTRLLAGNLARARRTQGRFDEAGVARALRLTFEGLGGTFTKFGQLIASSPSIFGDEVAAEFRACLDAAPPVPYAEVARVLEHELGAPLDECFATFEREPIAAASLAVVHRATLTDGRAVAVKVLRPGIEAQIANDLAVLRPLMRFVARQIAVGVAGTFQGLVVGLEAQMTEELDLRNDARSSRWFEEVLASVDAKHVVVPAVIDERSGRRVLTMELIDGVPIDDHAAIDALGVDPRPLMQECLRTWFTATLATGAFHGDIHAGNVLVQADGTVALLDWGIVGRLDDETAVFFRRMMEGVVGDEAAWVDVAAHIERSYGSGLREVIGLDDAAYVAFVRSQIEPIMRSPFGEVDLSAMLIDDSTGEVAERRAAADGSRRRRRDVVRDWWAERKRQNALMDVEGYGGGFDQATFLLAKQLVYFERYGKLYLPDTPLLDDLDAYRDLLAATAR